MWLGNDQGLFRLTRRPPRGRRVDVPVSGRHAGPRRHGRSGTGTCRWWPDAMARRRHRRDFPTRRPARRRAQTRPFDPDGTRGSARPARLWRPAKRTMVRLHARPACSTTLMWASYRRRDSATWDVVNSRDLEGQPAEPSPRVGDCAAQVESIVYGEAGRHARPRVQRTAHNPAGWRARDAGCGSRRQGRVVSTRRTCQPGLSGRH